MTRMMIGRIMILGDHDHDQPEIRSAAPAGPSQYFWAAAVTRDWQAATVTAAAAVRQLMFLDRLLEETDHAEEDLLGA